MQEEPENTQPTSSENNEEQLTSGSTTSSSTTTLPKNSYLRHAIHTGLYLSVISIFTTALTYAIDENSLLSKFSISNILALLLILALCIFRGKQFARQQQPFFTYSSSFGYSFLAMYTSTLIATVWNVLFYHIIDPELTERLLYIQEEKIYEQFQDKESVEEIVEQSMRVTRWFFGPFGLLISGAVFGGVFSGAVLGGFGSLLISLLTALGIRKT